MRGMTGNFNPHRPGGGAALGGGRGASRMEPSIFATWGLGAGPSIQIVGRRAFPQRVLLHEIGAGLAFVSDTPNAGIGTRAIQVSAVGPQVIVVGPEQDLYAAGTAPGGLLSVAISASIPAPADGGGRRMGPSSFEAIPPGQLLDISDLPRRVTISLPTLAFGQVGSQPIVTPASGFQLVGTTAYTFVVAPGQALYGTLGVGSVFAAFSVHASDLVASRPRGPTGIPGPDGQE